MGRGVTLRCRTTVASRRIARFFLAVAVGFFLVNTPVAGGILTGHRVLSPTWGSAAVGPEPRWRTGCSEALVRLEKGLSNAAGRAFLAPYGQVVRRLPAIDVWVISECRTTASTLVDELTGRDGVLWAEPNGRYYALGITPDDNFYLAQQENLRQMGLPEAWVFTTGGTYPIAVLDGGVDLDHPDLAARIWVNPGEVPANGVDDDQNGYVDDVHGWNFVHGSTLLTEDPHGTHVAGIAGAHTDNGLGVAGVTWEGPLMSLQVLQAGSGEWADVAEAVVYAADNGARVLNLSLGGSEPSQTIEAAVAYARDRGCLLVAAVGNRDGASTSVLYPAALPAVLAVAATTAEDLPWSEGNRGPEVDLAAPGVEIVSTSSYGRYAKMTGTSMATPHVSGLASLVWSLRPTLTADQVAQVITGTAHDIYPFGRDERTGWGRVDAQEAILHLVQPEVTLVANRALILAERESAVLTATVNYGQGLAVPDGLTVAFHASLGRVNPSASTTRGGIVTATFTSTRTGVSTITARVGNSYAATVMPLVISGRFYLPLLMR
jgi:hypothetical protein